jgi:hypothetical protein
MRPASLAQTFHVAIVIGWPDSSRRGAELPGRMTRRSSNSESSIYPNTSGLTTITKTMASVIVPAAASDQTGVVDRTQRVSSGVAASSVVASAARAGVL